MIRKGRGLSARKHKRCERKGNRGFHVGSVVKGI
jgi:hypothetical protein